MTLPRRDAGNLYKALTRFALKVARTATGLRIFPEHVTCTLQPPDLKAQMAFLIVIHFARSPDSSIWIKYRFASSID
jgi:hypothetical protein